MINVYKPELHEDISELDDFLWEVLWKPLGLPKNIRDSFKLDGKCLKLVARSEDGLAGGLVANWTTPSEVEIRHIAIRPETRKQGIGILLVAVLLKEISAQGCTRVYTIARNTSVDFFHKIGFRTLPEKPPEHPTFAKHGITFELMEKQVKQT